MIVGYPQDSMSPHLRVGGFYATVEAAEQASELLELDVLLPPPSRLGWFLVPTGGGIAMIGDPAPEVTGTPTDERPESR